MRAVSINLKAVKYLLKNKSDDVDNEIEYYIANKNHYKSMFIEQGPLFWTKFIIMIKEAYIGFGLYYQHLGDDDLFVTENSEQLIVDFLDTLLSGNFASVSSFIDVITFEFKPEGRTAHIQLTRNLQKLKKLFKKKGFEFSRKELLNKNSAGDIIRRIGGCMAMFFRIYSIWKDAPSGEETNWTAPNYWFDPVHREDKLEMYIKSKWREDEIETIFSICPEQICWLWQTPRPMFPSVNPDQALSYTSLVTETREISTLDTKLKIVSQKTPPECITSSLCWLQPPTERKASSENDFEMGNLELLRQSNSNTLRMWILVEISVPPLLKRNFHIANSEKFEEEGLGSVDFMATVMSYAISHQSICKQLFCGVNENHSKLAELNKNPSIANGNWMGTELEPEVNTWRMIKLSTCP